MNEFHVLLTLLNPKLKHHVDKIQVVSYDLLRKTKQRAIKDLAEFIQEHDNQQIQDEEEDSVTLPVIQIILKCHLWHPNFIF